MTIFYARTYLCNSDLTLKQLSWFCFRLSSMQSYMESWRNKDNTKVKKRDFPPLDRVRSAVFYYCFNRVNCSLNRFFDWRFIPTRERGYSLFLEEVQINDCKVLSYISSVHQSVIFPACTRGCVQLPSTLMPSNSSGNCIEDSRKQNHDNCFNVRSLLQR